MMQADKNSSPLDSPSLPYLDCAATTPLEPAVLERMLHFFALEYGNAGSRTHAYGARAKQAVEAARDAVAAIVGVQRDAVHFTSGATESNNLALLGLRTYGRQTGRRHIISSRLEHKAVLEPLELLAKEGFEVTWVTPTRGGWVEPDSIRDALRPDTLVVSVMHVNNETGIVQPIEAIAGVLEGHPAYFHVDGAQGFGKELDALRLPRLDLISVSAHKLYGPKGIGALIARRRGFEKVPLSPLMVGGGQERGLRPGTLPVPLIAGLGCTAELALERHARRREANQGFRQRLLTALAPLEPVLTGDQTRAIPHILNLRFPGIDSEAVMVALKGVAAVSNGSACTSSSYAPSHVLLAMGMDEDEAQEAVRISWCQLSEDPDWIAMREAIEGLR